MVSLPDFQVFAIRYATSGPRSRRENFIMTDAHDAPMPMDYFVWLIRGAGRVVVVDTGFKPDAALRRRRVWLRDPSESLKLLGVEPARVDDVILTHLHYDHAGNVGAFPRARFHLQAAEMEYATGRHMRHHCLSMPFDVDDVVEVLRCVYVDRVDFHDGTAEVAAGITLHKVGGHTGGLQIVRVHTARGWLVLASDAFHFGENRQKRSPFPLVFNVGDMLEGFRLCESLADGNDMIIPGHDPEILERWPKVFDDNDDIVRLDLPPAGELAGSK